MLVLAVLLAWLLFGFFAWCLLRVGAKSDERLHLRCLRCGALVPWPRGAHLPGPHDCSPRCAKDKEEL